MRPTCKQCGHSMTESEQTYFGDRCEYCAARSADPDLQKIAATFEREEN